LSSRFDYLEKSLCNEYSFIIFVMKSFLSRFYILNYNYWGKLFVKNSLILEKVRYVEVKSSSPFLPYTPLSFTSLSANLPSIFYSSLTTLPSRFPTPSFYLPLLLPFPIFLFPSLSRSSLYSSFPHNLPLSISIFPFPSQSSPFPLNLLRL